jgi:hypothetical protein
MISVSEAAIELGVSERRIRELIRLEKIQATKQSGVWLINPNGMRPFKPTGKPLSSRLALAFALAADGHDLPVNALDKHRVRNLLDKSKASINENATDALLLVASWLKNRADRKEFACDNLTDLSKDNRFVVSGVSAARSGLTSSNWLEGYVERKDYDDLRIDYWIKPAHISEANLTIYLTDYLLPNPIPTLYIVADLADIGGIRETSKAKTLLKEWANINDKTSTLNK